jgi:microcin C transport system substrate-binding protein
VDAGFTGMENASMKRLRRLDLAHLVAVCAVGLVPFAAFGAADGGATCAMSPHWVHAFAAFGEPKYPRGFDHFGYVNPDAPKGGTLYLRNPDRRQSFDKFNPFTVSGSAPGGETIFMVESLMANSADEPRTMYGLLAQEMCVEPDHSAITFRLNPLAHFSNGDPVTTEDVKFTFDAITSKYASPSLVQSLQGIRAATVIDARTIRFELADTSTDTLFQAGGIPVVSHKWGLRADGSRARLDQIVDEKPITSGPYTVAEESSGRRIVFARNREYWARDLGVVRGMYNFDRIVYRYYQDEEVAIEAFKAGEFDLIRIYGARSWARQMRGSKWDDGRIVKRAFPVGTGQGLQSLQLNLRRPQFRDIRVREALELAFDFDTTNRYKVYRRADSVFNNSEFAAQGLPGAGELALLEPYRADLPAAVFGPPYVAPSTLGGSEALRHNLLKAKSLLADAGWRLGPDHWLHDARGQILSIEYLAPGDSNDNPEMKLWGLNLERLGIQLHIRNVDFALYQRRLDEYDFDVVTIVEGAFTLPSPATYLSLYSSKSADEKGNGNFRGIKSPAVDHVLAAMSSATTLESFRDACGALDRIVMWDHWQVPDLYIDVERISYWNKFGLPEVLPLYFTADLPPEDDSQLPWPLVTWWIANPAAR